MRPLGLLLIALALALPLVPFWSLAGQHSPVAIFSQYLGSAALIAMGLSQLMATRLPGLEAIFGGLDRIYVIHKWLGIGTMAAILLHDTIDAEIDGLGRETALVELADTFGEISLYGLLILTAITVLTFVPYQLWHLTHKFMGAFYAMATIHYVFMLKPFEIADPLGLYVLGFCVLGLLSYAYTLVPQRYWRGRHRYVVNGIEPTGDAAAITLSPAGRGIRHQAGQFAFVRFGRTGETHPFSISAAPNDERTLRFTVKALGDFTRSLPGRLEPGSDVLVSPAFGHFRAGQGDAPQVWIGAGVGITPFLAMAGGLPAKHGPVHLFYSVHDRSSAPHLAELEARAIEDEAFTLHVVESGKDGRLTAQRVADAIGSPMADVGVWFCGPAAMRKSLRGDFQILGLSASKFHHEEFEIRSGLGFRRLARWLYERMRAGR